MNNKEQIKQDFIKKLRAFVDELSDYSQTKAIASVIKDFQFFVREKWEIASDSSGSGNTANIGSITNIEDLINGNGMFKNLGEKFFDEYWMNYKKITITTSNGTTKKISKLSEYLEYKGLDIKLINPKAKKIKKKS